MNLSEAQQYIADSNAGKVSWDDNQRSAASKIVDSFDPQKQIERAIQLQKDAVKPAVDSLQASIPEIQSKYAQTRTQLQAQQPALEERYKSLLDSIKGQGTQDVNNQTRITNQELGKRGITGSSTMAQQEIQNTTSPLMQKYAGLEKDTSLAREDSLRQLQDSIANLTPQETADQRAIQNAIAQLYAGAGQTGASQGIQLYSTNLSNQLQQDQLAEQKRQNALAQTLQQYQLDQAKQTDPIQLEMLKTQLAKAQQPAQSSTGDLSSLMSILGFGGATKPTEKKPSVYGMSTNSGPVYYGG